MPDPGEATTATHFITRTPQGVRRAPLTQRAPGPEAPEVRDRTGARTGLLIVLVVCLAFWGAIASVVAHLLR